MKKLISVYFLLGSSTLMAADLINIRVTTTEPTAAGIGYSVNGKQTGGAGKSYIGKGPRNGTYSFGYRKDSAQGPDISCGTHVLTKNSNVMLITKRGKCRSIISK